MNRKLRDKWIRALRSGKYKQVTGWLKRPKSNDYCCLGVLCNVAGETRGIESYRSLTSFNKLKKFKLSEGEEEELVNMNDTTGNDFNSIADWIEANL